MLYIVTCDNCGEYLNTVTNLDTYDFYCPLCKLTNRIKIVTVP